ncbi:MAG: hypothetical protein N2258_03260 [Brevinematales bacterium]|nr:hypothetical protein [Brevinematales bacterium]
MILDTNVILLPRVETALGFTDRTGFSTVTNRLIDEGFYIFDKKMIKYYKEGFYGGYEKQDKILSEKVCRDK